MKRFIRIYHRMGSAEKILFFSLIFSFVFTFFDWFYQIQMSLTMNDQGNYEQYISFSAYDGIAAVIGYFYSLFVVTTFIILILSMYDKYILSFVSKNSWLYLFLTGESLFLLILSFLIYTNYSLQFTKAGIKYGLVMGIVCNLLALFAAHFYFLQNRKKNIKKAFQNNNNTVSLEHDVDESLKTVKNETHKQMSFADYQ